MRPTTVASSAYFRMWLVLNLGQQSWVIRMNSRGLRTQPWEVPVFREMTPELFLSPRTDWVLRTASIHGCTGGEQWRWHPQWSGRGGMQKYGDDMVLQHFRMVDVSATGRKSLRQCNGWFPWYWNYCSCHETRGDDSLVKWSIENVCEHRTARRLL